MTPTELQAMIDAAMAGIARMEERIARMEARQARMDSCGVKPAPTPEFRYFTDNANFWKFTGESGQFRLGTESKWNDSICEIGLMHGPRIKEITAAEAES